MAFATLRWVPSMPILWKSFNHKWMLSLVKDFFSIYWDYHMVFIFQFVNMVYHMDWFVYTDESLHPGIKPTWPWCMSFLMCCWILFAKILLRIFVSVMLACSFLFLCCLCLILVSGWWWPCRMSLEMFLPLQFLRRVLEG